METFDEAFVGGDTFMIFFGLILAIMIGIVLYHVLTNLVRWQKNNLSEIESYHAKVVSKRMDVKNYRHTNGATGTGSITSSTSYYVTFERMDNHRVELQVKGKQYGLIAEQDEGELRFQGTRFLSFERL